MNSIRHAALLIAASLMALPLFAHADDPIVGRWRWFNSEIKVFRSDGTAVGNGFHGTWKCVSRATPPTYEVNWSDRWVDKVRLVKGGKELKGKNKQGGAVSAYRLPDKS